MFILDKSNRTLGRDYVLRNLLTVHSSLIQDISLGIRQYNHHIQNSCTFFAKRYLNMLGFFHPSQYYLVPIMAVTYIILYGLKFEKSSKNKGIPLQLYYEYWN